MKRLLSALVLVSLLSTEPCSAWFFGQKKAEPAPQSAQTKKVEIFVTSWCPYCRKLESFLKTNGIEYTRYDVENDEAGSQLFSELGGEGVPVTRVGHRVIHGYDPESIVAALQARA